MNVNQPCGWVAPNATAQSSAVTQSTDVPWGTARVSVGSLFHDGGTAPVQHRLVILLPLGRNLDLVFAALIGRRNDGGGAFHTHENDVTNVVGRRSAAHIKPDARVKAQQAVEHRTGAEDFGAPLKAVSTPDPGIDHRNFHSGIETQIYNGLGRLQVSENEPSAVEHS